jgi:anti-anti-sigma factor
MTADDRDYTLRWAGSQAVITMPAEIDATNAGRVRRELLSAATPEVPVLIIDMTGTTFCDCAGVRAIIAAYQHAALTGTQLRLAATTVLRIFTIIGADQLIPVYPALEAALADTPAGPSQPA